MLFASAIFVVVLSVGLAIDGARAYNVSTRIGAALDAAALAAAKLLDDEDATNAEIEDRAKRFFAAHFERTPIAGITVPEPVVTINRETGDVNVAVDVSVAATFAQLAGIESFNFPRAARVRYNQKHVEVALVLDITGSMCSPCDKIEGLKLASRAAIGSLINPSIPHGYIRVGIVPYSASVNAGAYAADVSNGNSTDGCVVEREGSHNDDDHRANGGNSLGTSSAAANPKYSCAASPIMPLSADRATLETKIDSLLPGGWTAGHIGLAWGWYLISERWDDFWPSESRPRRKGPNVVKAVVFMTDGEFNTSYLPGAGFNSTSVSTANSSPEQTTRLCANMKAEGVVIYTVAFQSPASARDLLQGCASSAGHAFTAESNADLFTAFRTIAERLSALRLTG